MQTSTDQNRERIQEDLRGLICGEILCDGIFRQLYASDGSIYEIRPLGVVRPRLAADVEATVKYAAEKRIPIHARGAGTGVAGQSLGRGLVIDFSAHLHRIVEIGERAVRVQPGVVQQRLNRQLAAVGRVFGPDPGNSRITTMGSVLAIDGAGSHWLKYGSVADHVIDMSVVLADGRRITAGREPLLDGRSRDADPQKRELIDRLVELLHKNRALIDRTGLKSPVDCCGYHLQGAIGRDDAYRPCLDLKRLLVGSEGTLALTTEATLVTQPLPAYCGTALLLFDSLEKATRAVNDLLPHKPAACELLDRRFISLAREIEPRFNELIPQQTEAVLLVEQHGESQVDMRDKLRETVAAASHKNMAFAVRLAFAQTDINLFWQLVQKALPALGCLEGASRPLPIVEDIAVGPEKLPDFLVAAQNILKRHEITAAVFCHAAAGQLHLQPFLDLGNPRDVERMRRTADDLYDEVFAVGGTISGEHGCGLSRSPFVERQNAELYPVFREVKRIFDPHDLLNPGKIVGSSPRQFGEHLRAVVPVEAATSVAHREPISTAASPSRLRNLIELQLNWDPQRLAAAARRCTSCGDCRTTAPDTRMCPVFRVHQSEEASPRAKANLARALLTKQIELESLATDELKRVMDLCFNCHMCIEDCPAGVDIPRLVAECKASHAAAKGLPPVDQVMMRLDLIGSLAGSCQTLSNLALANRRFRWLMEKTIGIAQQRKLPRVASPSLLRRAARRRLNRPRRQRDLKAAYFVDTYANFFDPQLAESLIAVLKHNGVAIFIPPEQMQAGTPSITTGSLDHARRLARQNTTVLADAVRQGYRVITTEPAAALTLVREYPQLLDNDDAQLVAANTTDAGAFLWEMHFQGKLQLDFKPILAAVAYHPPCRLRALRVGLPGENLLRLIPGLSVQRIEEGCCGMAGDFGIKQKNYRTSLRIGRRLIAALRSPKLQAGTTECSACKMQMEQGTTKPTVHPLKLLASAYGLMPELKNLLSTSSEDRLVS